ncbi:hypothetical protein KW850_02455 [Bacillus sp. sid0103]|uniref:hypothetical protein n=1 Tax=Bacillus sp. sid0103 TaxID=2856337 RepID=UPI001C444B4E|nr:hypothetical protein [Bacillus sp. sid0103]MBV7504125.1 hypothetical protein [Bacillus sp. sid0103]
MKVSSKLIFMLMLSIALVGLSGCAEKEKTASEVEKQTVEKQTVEAKTVETKTAAKTEEKKVETSEPKKQENQEKEIHDFVLKNTKIVQVSNISRRVHEKHPDLGPFYVVRGIDVRGQKSEVWIKDMKIFEMTNSK